METGFPILLILTNKECSHCTKMRGINGWLSDRLEKWNRHVFMNYLTIGRNDFVQRSRVIEIFFDKLMANPKVIEVTFFDLFKDEIMIKKYRPYSDNKVVILKENKNGFIDEKILPGFSFDRFLERYIPLTKIRRYLHVFPSFIYIHSTIWDNAIENDGPLYARVQGFKTVRDGKDPSIYRILREKRSDPEEKDRSPTDVLKKLLAFDLEPLYFPVDHGE